VPAAIADIMEEGRLRSMTSVMEAFQQKVDLLIQDLLQWKVVVQS
jgi:hypothetical protein